MNIQHITTEQTSQDSISCLPSLTRTDSNRKHFHIALHIIYTPKAQALFLDKFTKLQTFQSSSNLSLSLSLSLSKFLQQRLDYNYQAQRRKSSIRPRSPSYRSFTLDMSIKIMPFYPLQIHRSLQNYPPNLLLIVWSSSSNTQNCLLFVLRTRSHIRILPSVFLAPPQIAPPTSVGFLQKSPNSIVIPSDLTIPQFAVTAYPSYIRHHRHSSLFAATSQVPKAHKAREKATMHSMQ
jgi:hypothetical protein